MVALALDLVILSTQILKRSFKTGCDSTLTPASLAKTACVLVSRPRTLLNSVLSEEVLTPLSQVPTSPEKAASASKLIMATASRSKNSGVGLTFGPKSPIRIDVGYLAGAGNDPGEDAGLFNGSYSALGQVTFQPIKGFSVAATYVHAYSSNPDSAIGNAALGGALGHGTGSIGSQVNNTQRPVVSNSYGVEASFSFTPQLSLSGWAGYTDAIVLGRGSADVWNYAATLAINDFGTKGSTLGFVVGMEPKLTGTSNQTVATLINGVNGGRRKDPDTGLHVEGFYRFALTKNITITPGVIWLTAPGHNEDNDDIFIGTVRTTFTF